jgi:hypothetical protein
VQSSVWCQVELLGEAELEEWKRSTVDS